MTSRDVLSDAIEEWHKNIGTEDIVPRDLINELLPSLSQEEVTILTGVRRSGKTFMLYDLVRRQGGTYLNFEDDRLYDFTLEDFEKVMDIVNETGSKILYLDEVQEIPGWEKFAHRAHRKIKIVVTGSNSALLSADYSKALVGRTKTFFCHPLNFSEFLRFRRKTPSRNSFLEYLRVGGFPRIVQTGDLGLAQEYLDRIIHRDIIGKKNIRRSKAVVDLVRYLLSNIGKEFSYRSLKAVSGLKHDATVKQYLSYLTEAYLFTIIPRFSGSLRKQESYPKKIYAMDAALINLGKRLDDDRGLVLENIIFNHLSRSWDVYFYRDGYEVDFLLCRGTKQYEAVNVTFEALKEKTKDREVKGLQEIKKRYKIKTRLISVYPIKGLPRAIENNLAHRYVK